MHEHYTPKDLARFWRKVNRAFHPRGCWIWTAALTPRGYGTFGINGHVVSTSRFSYFLANGEFPSELFVLHECDTPACVNPSHLFLGTHLDNMRDMDAKGRRRIPFSKLTSEQREDILIKWKSGGVKRKELAAEYGVTPQSIGKIILKDMRK